MARLLHLPAARLVAPTYSSHGPVAARPPGSIGTLPGSVAQFGSRACGQCFSPSCSAVNQGLSGQAVVETFVVWLATVKQCAARWKRDPVDALAPRTPRSGTEHRRTALQDAVGAACDKCDGQSCRARVVMERSSGSQPEPVDARACFPSFELNKNKPPRVTSAPGPSTDNR